ncbi:ABC transporter substrate-binding protein [Homoserinimonas aerilata]|uniref:ABC transporter substrate-binding protein n=1 Tax=Homoserinimonas aerilata TaxID=1162970 RepID=UPI00163A82F0|nr:ABC transporter substrate-binding protein [Homoserinimonas aerilata]
MNKKLLACIAMASAAGMLLAGCAEADAGAKTGLTEVTIGVVPGADLAPLFLAQQEGLFAEHGITLTINSLASTTAGIVTAVDAEKFDFGYSDAITLLKAREDGTKLHLVGAAAATSGDTALDYAALVVNADSPVTSLAQLHGATVAVDAIGTTNQAVVQMVIDETEADGDTVTWRAIPFIDGAQAVADGSVDAALLVEPFVTEARLNGMRVLAYPYAEFSPDLTVSAYFTSEDTAKSHPELVERFTAAIEDSLEYATSEPDKVRNNITTYIASGADVRSRLALPRFSNEIDRAALNKLINAGLRFHFLSSKPQIDDLLP